MALFDIYGFAANWELHVRCLHPFELLYTETYLSVKWILCQLEDTLECFCVDLLHSQTIFFPFENTSFFKFCEWIRGVTSLPKNM